jgi:hypothetical protein
MLLPIKESSVTAVALSDPRPVGKGASKIKVLLLGASKNPEERSISVGKVAGDVTSGSVLKLRGLYVRAWETSEGYQRFSLNADSASALDTGNAKQTTLPLDTPARPRATVGAPASS